MRTAIIGAGRMGRRHIQVARSLGLEICGVCDVDQASLSQAAEEQSLREELLYSDATEMLGEGAAECVIVATTAPTHCSLTCSAAESGAKYILCEKPLAVSLEECDHMVDVCRKHGVHLSTNHQMRFMEQYTEPKRLSQTEAFGGLRSVTVSAGNFGLCMNGSHYFEMFRYMADAPPVEVTAWFSPDRVPNPRGSQFEDRAGCVRLVTEEGMRFYLDASADHGHGFRVIYGGRYGQIEVDEATGVLTMSVREEEHRALPTTRYLMPFTTTTKQIEPVDSAGPTRAVLKALLSGRDYPTGEDGSLAVRVLVAAHLSNELGQKAIRMDDPSIDPTLVFPWA